MLEYIQTCHSTGVVNFKIECGSPININSILQVLNFFNYLCLEFISLVWEALWAFLFPQFSHQLQPTLAHFLERNIQTIWYTVKFLRVLSTPVSIVIINYWF